MNYICPIARQNTYRCDYSKCIALWISLAEAVILQEVYTCQPDVILNNDNRALFTGKSITYPKQNII